MYTGLRATLAREIPGNVAMVRARAPLRVCKHDKPQAAGVLSLWAVLRSVHFANV